MTAEHTEQIIKKELSKKQRNLLNVLEASRGSVTECCKATGVGRTTFYMWIRDNPAFTEEVLNIREGIVDWAEGKLYEAIDKGNITALIFFLKCHGKKRGWTEKGDLGFEEDNQPTFALSEEDLKGLEPTRKIIALVDGTIARLREVDEDVSKVVDAELVQEVADILLEAT